MSISVSEELGEFGAADGAVAEDLAIGVGSQDFNGFKVKLHHIVGGKEFGDGCHSVGRIVRTDVLTDIAAIDAAGESKSGREFAVVFDSEIGVASAGVESAGIAKGFSRTGSEAGSATGTSFAET